MAFQFPVNHRQGTDRETDGRGATLYLPDTMYFGCQVHRRMYTHYGAAMTVAMLFWRCLNTNCTNMENTLFAKKWLLSLLNLRLQKKAQMPTTCNLQAVLSKHFKKTPIKSFCVIQQKNFSDNAQILAMMIQNTLSTTGMPSQTEKWCSVFELFAKHDFSKKDN